MSSKAMQRAKELIKEKRYDEARAILETVEHPTAKEWLLKLDKIAPARKSSPVNTISDRAKSHRRWRNIWGLLILLPLAWMCYGLFVSSSAYGEVADRATSEAGQAGAAIGASLGISIFICTALPAILFFAFFWWRNDVAYKRELHHAENISMMERR